MKKLLVSVILALCCFAAVFAGCNSGNQNELQSQIDELQSRIEEMDKQIKLLETQLNNKISAKTLYSLQDAYRYNLLTKENLMSIACRYYDNYGYEENPYAGKYTSTEELSESTATEIKQAYLEQIDLSEGDIDRVHIMWYFGNYNGNIAISIRSEYILIDPIIEEEYYLDGVLFKNFWPGSISVYHID